VSDKQRPHSQLIAARDPRAGPGNLDRALSGISA
jgi:hypothetical protein